jgi:hypothetical protein
MILWNYIHFNIYIYIYKPMVMYIAIIFNELFFNENLKIPKY